MSIESRGAPVTFTASLKVSRTRIVSPQQVGAVGARVRDHRHPGHRGRAPRRRRRRQPPVHLVRRVVREPRVAEQRVVARRRRADRRAAVEPQRVRQHRDALRREVGLHHLVDEHQRRRAGAALVDRPLLAPLGRVHVDRDPRRARHRHRPAEADPHPDPLAQAVGGVAPGIRHHRHPGHRRRRGRRAALDPQVRERRGEPAARAHDRPAAEGEAVPGQPGRALPDLGLGQRVGEGEFLAAGAPRIGRAALDVPEGDRHRRRALDRDWLGEDQRHLHRVACLPAPVRLRPDRRRRHPPAPRRRRAKPPRRPPPPRSPRRPASAPTPPPAPERPGSPSASTAR